MSNDFTRRDVLKTGGMIAVGLMAPPWLSAIAKGDMVRTSRGRAIDPDTVLVVCQLTGGNDGLNTVIPHSLDAYYKARPVLGIPADKVLKIDQNLGFHPAMTGMHQLYQEKKVAIVQAVGYPNPNRSHFKSMDIWHSASPDGRMNDGWIGRAIDLKLEHGAVDPVDVVGLSNEKPRALVGRKASIPCFASLTDIQSMVGDADSERMLREIQGMAAMEGTVTRTIQDSSKTALDAMATLKTKLATFTPKQTYGNDEFGRGFKQIANLVGSNAHTRVVYFRAGGFDTHSRQAESHEKLLGGFSNAMLAFQREMEAIGKADKVMVLVFSEFGRRTYENGSAGTDHGQAAPMFLVGKRVKGGLYGPNPTFDDLQDGDLRWKTDFRQVYATALDDWMGSDSKVVLGESFNPLGVIA